MFYYKITTTGRNSAAPSAIFQINWFDKRVASIDILLFVKTLENEKARRKFTRGNMKTNVPRQMHAAAIIITILRNFTGHRFSSSPSFLSFFLSLLSFFHEHFFRSIPESDFMFFFSPLFFLFFLFPFLKVTKFKRETAETVKLYGKAAHSPFDPLAITVPLERSLARWSWTSLSAIHCSDRTVKKETIQIRKLHGTTWCGSPLLLHTLPKIAHCVKKRRYRSTRHLRRLRTSTSNNEEETGRRGGKRRKKKKKKVKERSQRRHEIIAA